MAWSQVRCRLAGSVWARNCFGRAEGDEKFSVGQIAFGRRFFLAPAGSVKETQPEVYDLFQKGFRQKSVGAACELAPLAAGVLPTPCLIFAVEKADDSQTPQKIVELGPALRQEWERLVSGVWCDVLGVGEGAEPVSVGRVMLIEIGLAQKNRVGEVNPGVYDPLSRSFLQRRFVWDGFIAHTTGYNSHPDQPLR